ncbi:MAG: ATP-binding protein [Atopobiaceae bacterium]|nr:ATP-binding protein [Atopobiaceae bacterium]
MQNNPFTPFFGEVPIVMAGREQLLRSTSHAFASSMRAPELTMLLSGARGTGKTAPLTAMASQAKEAG